MSLLTKADIQKAKVTGFKEFDSKSLGGKVRFKRLSALGHDAIEAYTTTYKADKDDAGNDITVRDRNLTYFRAAYIAFSQVDEKGKLFWDGDVKAVGELSGEVMAELFDFAVEVNPKIENPEEVKTELAKNQEGSSSTD